jgi:2-dehydro-3-deoxy-D-arabinonate dehydratase
MARARACTLTCTTNPPANEVFACCALGPVIGTAEDLSDPYNSEMTCMVTRAGQPRFSGSVSRAKLHRKFDTLIEYLGAPTERLPELCC